MQKRKREIMGSVARAHPRTAGLAWYVTSAAIYSGFEGKLLMAEGPCEILAYPHEHPVQIALYEGRRQATDYELLVPVPSPEGDYWIADDAPAVDVGEGQVGLWSVQRWENGSWTEPARGILTRNDFKKSGAPFTIARFRETFLDHCVLERQADGTWIFHVALDD